MEAMILAPIALFVYNRPSHTKKTVESLLENQLAPDSTLYIFSDGYKGETDKSSVLAVREYIKTIRGFKEVIIKERDENWGLAKSVIKGASEILRKYGTIIAIEDDLLFSTKFLKFMNEGLNCYKDRKDIWSIGGCNYGIKLPDRYEKKCYLSIRVCSWGWATWEDRWSTVDWAVQDYEQLLKDKDRIRAFNRGGDDLFSMLKAQMNGEIDSWAVRWDYAASKQSRYTARSVINLVGNTGTDGSGVHWSSQEGEAILPSEIEWESTWDINIQPMDDIDQAVYNLYKRDWKHVCWDYVGWIMDAFGGRRLKLKLKKRIKRKK